MRTFNDFLESGDYVYPNIEGMDENFKVAINDWFGNREVASDEHFPLWFNRVLKRDFPHYAQLLRVEPSIAEYDWLVQQYEELMTETTGNTSANNQTSGKITTTSNGGATSDVINNLTDKTTQTGKETSEQTRTDALNRSRTSSNTNEYGHIVDVSGKTTTGASGSDTTKTESEADTKTLEKANPQSVTYSSGLHIDGTGGQDKGRLEWSYPSAQGENATTTEETSKTTYGREDETTTNGKTTNSGTDKQSGTDTESNTGTVTTAGERNSENTTTGTHTGTVTTTSESENESEQNSTNSTTSSGTSLNVVKSIHSGRAVDIATLLNNATDFIKNSIAFNWMLGRLEPCFIGLYDL